MRKNILTVGPSKAAAKTIWEMIAVTTTRDLDVNSLTVPRKAKEAIGGISRLTHENGVHYLFFHV